MVPRPPPPYLRPAKNPQHAAARGGRTEGKSRAGRRTFGVKRAQAVGMLGPSFADYWLGRGWSADAVGRAQRGCCDAGEHFLRCRSLNFSNACSAVTSEPPTKHQHCAHQCKWLPSLAELYIYRSHPHLSASAQKIQNTLWDSGDSAL